MPASSTSRDAYMRHVVNGKAITQRERILGFVRSCREPVSRAQIAYAFSLDWRATRQGGTTTWDGGPPIPLASVCGRVAALMAGGLIEHAGIAVDGRTGVGVELLRPVNPPPKQLSFDGYMRRDAA